MMLFRDAPAAIRDEGVDSLIVDQVEPAGGTVADHLGLPFVSAAAARPINLDGSVPPVNLPWPYDTGVRARLRNWGGTRLASGPSRGSYRRSTDSAGPGGGGYPLLPRGRLRAVMEHIEEHLDGCPTLAQLAAVVRLNPYHFARRFKAATWSCRRAPVRHPALPRRAGMAAPARPGTDLSLAESRPARRPLP